MARRVGRSQWAQETIGFLLAAYLGLVRRTSRFTTVPDDLDAYIKDDLPLIAAMWHGQHLMMPFARPATMDRLAVLISRHEDAGAQAMAAERLGITAVRGSGGPADRAYYKGGAPAMRELLRQLELGVFGRDDRRCAQARAGGGRGRRRAGQTFRPSDRSDRGGDEPAGAVRHLGSRHAWIAVRARGGGRGRTSSAFRPTPTTTKSRPRGSPSSGGSTRSHRKAYAMVGAQDPGADLRRP